MKYTTKQYAAALFQAVFESRPQDQERVLDNFAAVLKENRDLGKLNEIEHEFFNYERESRGVSLAEITTAQPMSLASEQKIIRELNEYVGGQVELKKKVDEGLVGGVVIKLGDELIDGSVRKNLKDLKKQLIQ